MRRIIVWLLFVATALLSGCSIELSEPYASVHGGMFNAPVTVSLSCDTSKSTIKYTVDGTDPVSCGTVYTSPLTIGRTSKLQFVSMDKKGTASNVINELYRIVGPAGGYVFYDCDADNDSGNADGLISTECGWRYLEAAPQDVTVGSSSTFRFGFCRTAGGQNQFVNGSTYVAGTTSADDGRSTGTAVGTGKANTAKLVDAMGSAAYSSLMGSSTTTDYAAKVCYDYSVGAYDDWFLPSKDELALMDANLYAFRLGSFEGIGIYASSSEYYDVGSVWIQVFGNEYGLRTGNGRDCVCSVRAIRSFMDF